MNGTQLLLVPLRQQKKTEPQLRSIIAFNRAVPHTHTYTVDTVDFPHKADSEKH